jgi:hypothetical protein
MTRFENVGVSAFLAKYSSVIRSFRMRWAGHVARMRDKRVAYTDSMERSEGSKPFGKPRRRWTDNIKLHLKETGLPGVVWIYLAQDRDN